MMKENSSCSDEKGDCHMSDETERGWSQLLSEQAAERVSRIQRTAHFDHVEAQAGVALENGTTSDSDDVKWLETLLHFVVAALKSGRSLYLVEILVGILYPVISLQSKLSELETDLARAKKGKPPLKDRDGKQKRNLSSEA